MIFQRIMFVFNLNYILHSFYHFVLKIKSHLHWLAVSGLVIWFLKIRKSPYRSYVKYCCFLI